MPRSGFFVTAVLTALTIAPSATFACVVSPCAEIALNACLPGGGNFDGSVTFNCGGPATIAVTSTKTISTDTVIDGGGAVTISGGNSIGIFTVTFGVTFAVQNLTIANGLADNGGGIRNSGTLAVTNCTFSGDSARTVGGAIENGGAVSVVNSAFFGNSGYGGAIDNIGTVTVTNSTFSGDNAGGYGHIANFGRLTVTNSTFSGNSGGEFLIGNNSTGTIAITDSTFSGNGNANSVVEAIFNTGHGTVMNCTFSDNNGGGIGNNGVLTVINSTFSGNSATNGFVAAMLNEDSGTVTVANCTFSGNNGNSTPGMERAGGINNTAANNIGTVKVINSILEKSISGGNCMGVITDGGHNIDDGTTCAFTGAGCAMNTGTSSCNTNPLLDPAGLASNGGVTQTIALEAESPAIDAGDETVCAEPPVNNLDQRGFIRPGMGATNCSIGAYEFDATPSSSTTTTTPGGSRTTSTAPNINPTTTTTLSCTSARCTLNAALMSPACVRENIPASVTGKLTTAETLIEQASTAPGKPARKLLKRAKTMLKQVGAKAARAAKAKKAKLSPGCADAIRNAVDAVRGGLAA